MTVVDAELMPMVWSMDCHQEVPLLPVYQAAGLDFDSMLQPNILAECLPQASGWMKSS
jgi:hypothetical protein